MEKINFNEIFIYDNGKMILAKLHPNFCKRLYAASGYDTTPGNLFAVMWGPRLFPAYDNNGTRINVGEAYAGMTYSEKRGWYNE